MILHALLTLQALAAAAIYAKLLSLPRQTGPTWEPHKEDDHGTNPFVNLTPNIRHPFGVAIAAVTLLPLRLLVIVGSFVVMAFFAKIAMIGANMHQPLRGWRRALLRLTIQPTLRVMLFLGLGLVTLPVKGRRATAAEAPVLVSNHVSFVEPVVLHALNLPAAVGAVEHLGVPLLGTVVRALQVVAVDRRSPTSRQDVVRTISERARSGGRWPQTLIFPEGTTTSGRALIMFKRGAFLPGAPVQPVTVRYPRSADFDPCWVTGGPSALHLALRLLCRPRNHVAVEYLPVYTPSEAERADPDLFARNVRHVIAEALRVPVTSHTFEDVVLSVRAMKHHLPAQTGVVEFGSLRAVVDVDLKTALSHEERFAQQAPHGYLDVDGWVRAFGFSEQQRPLGERLFFLLADDEGHLSFRQYLVGVLLVAAPKEREAALRLAFRVLDRDGDGGLDQAEFGELMAVARAAGVQGAPAAADVERLFRSADRDGTGKINFEEWVAFAEDHSELVGVLRAPFVSG